MLRAFIECLHFWPLISNRKVVKKTTLTLEKTTNGLSLMYLSKINVIPRQSTGRIKNCSGGCSESEEGIISQNKKNGS